MSQHFLLSSRAKTLTLASVARMSDEEAEMVFRKIRWANNNGDPFCPKCGCTIVYDCRRANGAARWRCKACRHSFSITSGTLFHSRKMPLRAYLLAIAIFCNEVKGKSMLALSRDLGTHSMTAFVLAHKIREAMASEVRQTAVGGEGKRAEIDGGYFWRLREARQSTREPPRSPVAAASVRQASGRGRDPRAQRQDAAGCLSERG
jgi:transposase-like protein